MSCSEPSGDLVLTGAAEVVEKELRSLSKERLDAEIVRAACNADELQRRAISAFKHLALLISEMQRRTNGEWQPYVELRDRVPRGSISNSSIIQPVVRAFLDGAISHQAWEKLSFQSCLKLRTQNIGTMTRLAPVLVEYPGLSGTQLTAILDTPNPMRAAKELVETAASEVPTPTFDPTPEPKIFRQPSQSVGSSREAANIAQLRLGIIEVEKCLRRLGMPANWTDEMRATVCEILSPIVDVRNHLARDEGRN